MQMKYSLTAVTVSIDYCAITIFGKILAASDFRAGQKQMSEHCRMLFRGFIKRPEMLARNYQNVRRSLRLNVVKSYAKVVFIDQLCGNFSFYYFAKNTIFFTHKIQPKQNNTQSSVSVIKLNLSAEKQLPTLTEKIRLFKSDTILTYPTFPDEIKICLRVKKFCIFSFKIRNIFVF